MLFYLKKIYMFVLLVVVFYSLIIYLFFNDNNPDFVYFFS